MRKYFNKLLAVRVQLTKVFLLTGGLMRKYFNKLLAVRVQLTKVFLLTGGLTSIIWGIGKWSVPFAMVTGGLFALALLWLITVAEGRNN